MLNWIPTRSMVVNSLKISLVVGVILNLINQWGVIFSGDSLRWDMLGLNFLVPFCVATFSALRNQSQEIFPQYNPNPVLGVSMEDGCILYANPAAHRLKKSEDTDHHRLKELLPSDYQERLKNQSQAGRSNDRWLQPIGDNIYEYHINIIPRLERAHIYLENVTGREQATQQLAWQAGHDSITHMPNRRSLIEDLKTWIAQGDSLSLGFVWVEGLAKTAVRDGYLMADEVIQTLANRLLEFDHNCNDPVHNTIKCYRFDGYIFAVVICGQVQEQQAELAQAFCEQVTQPLYVKDRRVQLGARLGLVRHQPGFGVDRMVDYANTALHHAQQKVHQEIVWYDDFLGEAVQRMLELEEGLSDAIGREELRLFYQPQVRLGSGEIVGVEALMRWYHGGEMVSPAEFIPIAERSGTIVELGRWALDQACQQWLNWHQAGLIKADFTIAVNVSANEFLRPDFLADVRHLLSSYEIPPRALELEITETAFLTDSEACISTMHALRAMGLELAIDDFGTGYSSLNYLRRMPVNKLKIDRSFVIDVETDVQDALVVKTIIDMAHGLGLQVITEGIESAAQSTRLLELGSDLGQGYWHSRPAPAGELTAKLTEVQSRV